jgi:hypothetical protein
MAGSSDSGSNSGNGGDGGVRAAVAIRERIIAALVTIILGGGGAAGYLNINPPRKDPWTGTQAKESHLEMLKYINLRMEPMDKHLIKADRGWEMIYQMQSDIRLLKQRLGDHDAQQLGDGKR